MTSVLGYWDTRGHGEQIRLLLHFTGTEFEDKRYVFGPAPEYRSMWLKDKFKLGFKFPNLPYYIDGNVKLTHSLTILRYLARKHNLDGVGEEEKIRIDLVEQQVNDFKMNLIRLCIHSDFEKLRVDFENQVPPQLKQFADFLGECDWLAGSHLTYVDFMAYEAFDFYRILIPGCLDSFNLADYMNRFEELPTVYKYMNSGVFRRWPIFGPMFRFGWNNICVNFH